MVLWKWKSVKETGLNFSRKLNFMTALTELENYFAAHKEKESNMTNLSFCIYGCGGSNRDNWDNKQTVTINKTTVTLVACDSHPKSSFLSDVKELVKFQVLDMQSLKDTKLQVEADKNAVKDVVPSNGD